MRVDFVGDASSRFQGEVSAETITRIKLVRDCGRERGHEENNRLSEIEGRVILRNAGAWVKLLLLFVRVGLVVIGRGVKPVENVPKKIRRMLNRSGQAFRDWRGVHPETPFAFVALLAAEGKREGGLAGHGLGNFAE